jgi:hypothetical protein
VVGKARAATRSLPNTEAALRDALTPGTRGNGRLRPNPIELAMSRSALLFAAMLSTSLAACATSESSGSVTSESPPPPGSAPTELGCNADAARGMVGQTASADVVEKTRMAAGAQVARTLKPGQMVTMEYLAGRLNIDVDANNVITSVRCG